VSVMAHFVERLRLRESVAYAIIRSSLCTYHSYRAAKIGHHFLATKHNVHFILNNPQCTLAPCKQAGLSSFVFALHLNL
jgi:hypothetical protein